jgi:hypothetical protein
MCKVQRLMGGSPPSIVSPVREPLELDITTLNLEL